MVRARQTLKKGLPIVAGIMLGALIATLAAGQPAAAGVQQDPAVQMQIQQALSNFQVRLQTELNMMQTRIDQLEREQQNVRWQLSNEQRERALETMPIPADPIPGTTTYGRLVSESSESYRFQLHSPRGDLLARLADTADGPGLILFDATGQISVALLATPTGPELRMADADGALQPVLTGR